MQNTCLSCSVTERPGPQALTEEFHRRFASNGYAAPATTTHLVGGQSALGEEIAGVPHFFEDHLPDLGDIGVDVAGRLE